MWLLDRIEEEDKEYYDKIFNEYKTAFRKHLLNWTDDEIREHLETQLELAIEFKADFVYELIDDDLIVDNLDKFTEFFSKNVDRLI